MVQVASSEMWHGSPYPEEEAFIKKASPARKQEFTAGRLCARKALNRFGMKNFPVLVGENREPLWPPGIIGSISHCKGFCGVVMARRGPIISIGLDVEPLEPLTADVLGLVCTPNEKEWILSGTGSHSQLWSKLIFSAKESAFKCYFPLSQTFLDFQDVEVRVNPGNNSFTVSLRVPPPSTLPGVRVLNGRFASNRGYVFTGVNITSGEILLPE